MPDNNGLFIVFEGVEGAGKSTQSRELIRKLTSTGYDALLTIEPGGTTTGVQVRHWVKSGESITPLTELLLFSAARATLVETIIIPALANDKIVVCDRYIYSTIAYQGQGRGLDSELISSLNKIASIGLLPEMIILLDLPPAEGFRRKSDHNLDRIELAGEAFHSRVRQSYLSQAREDPTRWLVLDATTPQSEISAMVWKQVSNLLSIR